VNITGTISADGGTSGGSAGQGFGGSGGAGSGGAIRIVATTISGNGTINAGGEGSGSAAYGAGGNGGAGRIRLEAESITRAASTYPAYTFAPPGSLFATGLPTLNITSVAGVAITPGTEVMLPANTANPVTVTLTATGVPVGNTITLTVTPANTAPVTVASTALAGTPDNATASASINLSPGASTLSASVSYTVTTALGNALSTFAKGERVERVELSANTQGEAMTTLITVSGKRYPWPSKSITGVAG
jgi:hypothetical protein